LVTKKVINVYNKFEKLMQIEYGNNTINMTYSNDLSNLTKRKIDCVRFNPEMVNFETYLKSIYNNLNLNNYEENQYFYHSDHLGSSSFITDISGNAIQHLQYLPNGESFINQKTTTFDSRYTFSGKEKDIETDYGYFGARYYNSDFSIWLSVDMMSDKYPHLSGYNYCELNPIMLIDPDGNSSGRPTNYYDQEGVLIENVNDGIDQSVEVNREQYNSAKAAYTGNGNFKSQKDAAKFTSGYASLAKRFGGVFNLKGNWGTIGDVLADKEYVSYSSVGGNCNVAATQQNIIGGATPGGADSRIDVAVSACGGVIPVTANLSSAINIINSNLEKGYPVMLGLALYGAGSANNYNSATNHFVNINGRGNDYNGNFYTFRDNAYIGGGKLYYKNGYLISLDKLLNATEIRPNIKYK